VNPRRKWVQLRKGLCEIDKLVKSSARLRKWEKILAIEKGRKGSMRLRKRKRVCVRWRKKEGNKIK
jgi:hypothetical protein